MKFLSITAAVSAAILIQGCAGSVTSMVKESNKDSTFSYDGNYTLTVKHPGGRQELGSGWFNKCSAQDFTSRLSVKNSEVQWRMNKNTVANGFVNSDGNFRLEQLLESESKATSGVLSDGAITMILQGQLDGEVMKGKMVYGIAQFNNRGCSYPVSYAAG